MPLTRTAVALLGLLALVYGDHHGDHGPPAPFGMPGMGDGESFLPLPFIFSSFYLRSVQS